MANCYECLHYEACSDVGDAGFSYLKDGEEKCDHFKNKADFVEVKHGEWSVFKFRNPQCSRCHRDNIAKSRYCPHCGAKMDGERKETE